MSHAVSEHIHPRPAGAPNYGMTLREHYAGLAMQALLPTILTPWAHGAGKYSDPDAGAVIAAAAVRVADALIEELRK